MTVVAVGLALPRMSPRNAPLFRVNAKSLTVNRLPSRFICIILRDYVKYGTEKMHI